MSKQPETVVIAVDVLGGDAAPSVVLEGVTLALAADEGLTLLLTGPAEVVEPFALDHPQRVRPVATTEFIDMDEHPAQAVRSKKDSSIVVGCRLVANGEAHGFFSAGSTGACLAAATLYIGRVKGVIRPAIASLLPSPIAPVVLTDIGANADAKPEYLLQFAKMARVYATRILGIESPRTGLLNIGSEDTKGSQLALDSYRLLHDELEGFMGNAEGNDILAGRFDIIVTDGFTGNVTLKTIEGTAKTVFDQLKAIFSSSLKGKLAAVAVMPGLRELKNRLDANNTGGAPLLGLKGACIIGHGSSSAIGIANGIAVAARFVREDIAKHIAEAIASDQSQ
ncbi:MAG: phosphate acyltransferase PlsX [Coriobacteriaceae bacterium]|nr:phosphate acyltransferase PlsX [Coriobacteriaceae bacterium]